MSPPNLVLNRKLVPELQQEAVTAENITAEAVELLSNSDARQEIAAGYQEIAIAFRHSRSLRSGCTRNYSDCLLSNQAEFNQQN